VRPDGVALGALSIYFVAQLLKSSTSLRLVVQSNGKPEACVTLKESRQIKSKMLWQRGNPAASYLDFSRPMLVAPRTASAARWEALESQMDMAIH